ncbi:MAG: hypothetical protein ISR83_01385 [Candidatus Marinimicrobia bacterium]|nr:hypothetical protein [Candidatus Neomarinimicrobiota bacterium]
MLLLLTVLYIGFVDIGCKYNNNHQVQLFENPYKSIGEEHNKLLQEMFDNNEDMSDINAYLKYAGNTSRNNNDFVALVELIINQDFQDFEENWEVIFSNLSEHVAEIVKPEIVLTVNTILSSNDDNQITSICEELVNEYTTNHPKTVTACGSIATYFSSKEFWLSTGISEDELLGFVIADLLGAAAGAGASYLGDYLDGDEYGHGDAISQGLMVGLAVSGLYYAVH